MSKLQSYTAVLGENLDSLVHKHCIHILEKKYNYIYKHNKISNRGLIIGEDEDGLEVGPFYVIQIFYARIVKTRKGVLFGVCALEGFYGFYIYDVVKDKFLVRMNVSCHQAIKTHLKCWPNFHQTLNSHHRPHNHGNMQIAITKFMKSCPS